MHITVDNQNIRSSDLKLMRLQFERGSNDHVLTSLHANGNGLVVRVILNIFRDAEFSHGFVDAFRDEGWVRIWRLDRESIQTPYDMLMDGIAGGDKLEYGAGDRAMLLQIAKEVLVMQRRL